MKYLAVAAALVAITTALSIADVPACSLPCLTTAIQESGCSITDYNCLCGKANVLISAVTPCMKTACNDTSDQNKLLTVYEGVCQSAGVPINIASSSSVTVLASTSTLTSTTTRVSSSVVALSGLSSSLTSRLSSALGATGASGCVPVTVTVTSTARSGQTSATVPIPGVATTSSPPFPLPSTATRSSSFLPSGTGARTSSSRVPLFTGAASNVRGSVFAGVVGLAALAL